MEFLCVKAATKSHRPFIYSAYIPPVSSLEVYASHLTAIHAIATDPEDVLIIVGDFNLPRVQWSIDEDNILIPTAFDSSHSNYFINGLLSMSVYQVNSIRNSNDRLLDLYFTNDFTNISKPLMKVDDYHPPILATFEWYEPNNDTTSQPSKKFNFNLANYVGMNEHLTNVNFTEQFQGKTRTEKFQVLHNILDGAIKKYVLTVLVKRKYKFSWNNKKLQHLKNRKNKAWKRYKVTGDKQPFDKAFDEFDGLNTTLYNDYVEKLESSLKRDPS